MRRYRGNLLTITRQLYGSSDEACSIKNCFLRRPRTHIFQLTDAFEIDLADFDRSGGVTGRATSHTPKRRLSLPDGNCDLDFGAALPARPSADSSTFPGSSRGRSGLACLAITRFLYSSFRGSLLHAGRIVSKEPAAFPRGSRSRRESTTVRSSCPKRHRLRQRTLRFQKPRFLAGLRYDA